MSELLTLGRVQLVGDAVDDRAPAGAQPKRLVLLAYLALSGSARRDSLLALFWPEVGEHDARRSLRQALFNLRRALGENVIVGSGDELSLDPASLTCDAVTFEQLVAAGRFEEALELY